MGLLIFILLIVAIPFLIVLAFEPEPKKCERCGSTDIQTVRGYGNAWMYRCRSCDLR